MLDQSLLNLSVGSRQRFCLLVAMLVTIAIGIWHTLPPQIPPISQSLFSLEMAFAHVKRIASAPHPTGSIENTKVREYVVDQIKQAGYEPQVQTVTVVHPQKKLAVKVENILVRVPGVKPGRALLISAHYDSVPKGPGAADDGASVASMLEILKVIRHQSALDNDLIFLFTDAEEAGLLGAEGFVGQHPWAKDIGLALNFEYRGNSGSFMMFETSVGNGKMIAGLAKAAPSILANSMMYEVYKHLPNDTDLSVFKRAGIPGMNFAAIEGLHSYHTDLDNPKSLDQRTLQQEGELMLALSTYFGNQPLTDLVSDDRIYFDMPGLGLLHHSVIWVVPSAVFAALLFFALCALALKKNLVRVSRIVLAAIVFVLTALMLSGLSQMAWMLIRGIHAQCHAFVFGNSSTNNWYLAGFVLINTSLFGVVLDYAGKWLKINEIVLGSLLCWLLMLVISSKIVPGMSFLFFWPLVSLFVGLGMVLVRESKINSSAEVPSNKTHLFSLEPNLSNQQKHKVNNQLKIKTGQFFTCFWIFSATIPGMLIFTPIVKELFVGLSLNKIGVVVFFWTWLLGLLVALLQIIGFRKLLTKLALGLGCASIFIGSAMPG